MSSNILEPIPSALNDYLLKYSKTFLSNTTPSAPSGNTNVTFQKDGFGNISAYTPTASGGAPNPGTLNSLYKSDGAGGWTISSFSDNGSTVSATNLPFQAQQLISLSYISIPGGFFAGPSAIDPTYNIVSIKGNTATHNDTRILGGKATDPNMYLDTPSAGVFTFRAGSDTPIGTLSSSLFTAPALALTASTITTSATAGAATALPVTPLGYVEATITISGTPTVVKIPFYAV